jgi:integrase
MAATRTPGITLSADGRFFIDKRYRGIRIGMRVGPVTQDQAEQRLQTEMQHIDFELALRAHRRPTFADCARRYLAQSKDMRSLEAIRIHVELLVEHIGHLEPHQVHDATLAPLISERIADGVCAVTINRTLEVARTILHRAARSYRDENGRLRSPYPITWAEQDRLFPKLPGHLARMALFGVNTGLRDSNLCGLQWSWEVPVPEIGRSVFVVPEDEFKAKRPHVVILNDIAWSIIQTQRGKHAVWVFPYRGRRIARMNNSAWRQARRDAGLRSVRVHDLRHTYACRLRAAGVSAEDRAALLGHAT